MQSRSICIYRPLSVTISSSNRLSANDIVLESRPKNFADLLLLIAAADDMIERTGKVHARASGHDGFLTRKTFNKQISKA
jgi:hypothetical protein